jgi:RHS repeat-associated protein
LDYFEARYFSNVQGRFTSPDEFTGGPTELFAEVAAHNPTFYAETLEPQSLNKYAYCLNNPFKFVDPDGHQGIMADSLARKFIYSRQAIDFVKGVAKELANTVIGIGNAGTAVTGGEKTALYTSNSLSQEAGMIITRDVTIVGSFLGGKGPANVMVAESKPAATVAAKAGETATAATGGGQLVRFGKGPETTQQLAADAARAEAAGYPHGVSTKLVDRVSGSDKAHRSAPMGEVQKHFVVEQTGRNKKHHTVHLPKPVTEEVANKFNKIFRSKE